MNKTNKIHAFTLKEMLVVLLLTVIIIGMAFSVLNLVKRQMHGMENNFGKNTELNLLRRSLWLDFNQADGVWYNEKEGELFFEKGLTEVHYRFEPNFVVKEKDTFHIQFESKVFHFVGNAKTNGEIDALDFITGKENGSQKIFVYKKNATTSYMDY